MPQSTTGDSCSSWPSGRYVRLRQAQRQHGNVLVFSQHDEPSYSCISACWYDDGVPGRLAINYRKVMTNCLLCKSGGVDAGCAIPLVAAAGLAQLG